MRLDHSASEALRTAGFDGFIPIRELRSAPSAIPATRGVYVLLRSSTSSPEFIEVGTGGHFKGKNPNVPLSVLTQNWVHNTEVMYVGKAGDPGKAATLRSRLWQYLRFGAGAKVGHWGGRFVWQLRDVEDLVVAWLALPDGVPSDMESALIDEFRKQHGIRPFANLAK